MANVQLWGRLSNLWKGFVSLWLEDIEKNRPEIGYENAVQSMADKYVTLKRTTAAILRKREELESRLSEEQRELAQINQDLNAALDNGQDDLGVILVQKKKTREASLNELTAALTQTKGDADQAMSALMNVNAEIEKLKGEQDRMLAKFQSAPVRLKILNQLEGASVEADVKALESARSQLENVDAEAKLGHGLNQDDLDTRVKTLRPSAGSATTAKSELEALKAARAAHVKGGL